MSTVAELISQTVQVFISNKRLKEFLVADELVDYVRQPEAPPTTGYGYKEDVIDVQGATFTWEPEEPTLSLSNINLSVSRGQLIAIVGKVGSGKSSLLSSLLGEMERLRGYVGVRGTVAYVPQQPWILNETVRGNIVFGRHYNEKFYGRVLDACALQPDMNILSNGDLTEIGEKVGLTYLRSRQFDCFNALRVSTCLEAKSRESILLEVSTKITTSICLMILSALLMLTLENICSRMSLDPKEFSGKRLESL